MMERWLQHAARRTITMLLLLQYAINCSGSRAVVSTSNHDVYSVCRRQTFRLRTLVYSRCLGNKGKLMK